MEKTLRQKKGNNIGEKRKNSQNSSPKPFLSFSSFPLHLLEHASMGPTSSPSSTRTSFRRSELHCCRSCRPQHSILVSGPTSPALCYHPTRMYQHGLFVSLHESRLIIFNLQLPLKFVGNYRTWRSMCLLQRSSTPACCPT